MSRSFSSHLRVVTVSGMAATMLAAVSAGTAVAHHGIANFDLNRDVRVEGTIREVAFINPHSWLYFNAIAENGTLIEWKCELRGGTVLKRSGWTEEMFIPGAPITITGAPDRFEDNTCYTATITFEDGTTLNRYGQIEKPEVSVVPAGIQRLANGKPDFSGDWAGEQRVMTDPSGLRGALLPISVAEQLDPDDPQSIAMAFPGSRGTAASLADDPIRAAWSRPTAMELTAAGERAIAGFDPSSTDNPRLRCETTNIIFDWGFETVPNRIEHTIDGMVMRYGMMNLERTIHFADSFPMLIRPSRAGYSIARWEGDSLVVTTRGFLPGILSADAYTPHSDTLEVIERFTLSEDGSALQREYLATDRLFFSGNFGGRDVAYRSDLPWEPFSCDERSYRSDVNP